MYKIYINYGQTSGYGWEYLHLVRSPLGEAKLLTTDQLGTFIKGKRCKLIR